MSSPTTGTAPAAAATTVMSPRILVPVLAISILIAAYTGFRIPNSWSATLQAVSLFDGFHRRFVVGTLLHPLAAATGYDYWFFATCSYLILAALLSVLVVAALRTPLLSRRLLIVAWLLLPTGGFVVHELGYFDQVLYLLLFASMWLVHRGRHLAASGVMCVAPFVHEIAILTVIPIFGLVVLRDRPLRGAILATAPAALLNLIVLAIPPASAGAVASLSAALHDTNFQFRVDALALFNRSQSESLDLYSVHEVVVFVKPLAMLLVGAFVCLWAADRGFWRAERGRTPALLVFLASCVAISAPALLVYAGWDGNRWAFLLMSNFVLVVWISLGDGRRLELGAGAIAVLTASLLIIGRVPIYYFDGYSPRELGYRPVRVFLRQLGDHSLFTIPTM